MKMLENLTPKSQTQLESDIECVELGMSHITFLIGMTETARGCGACGAVDGGCRVSRVVRWMVVVACRVW